MNILQDKKNYKIGGRYTINDGRIFLAYSASYIEFMFEGDSVDAMIYTDHYGETDENRVWVAVFVNDGDVPVKRFDLKKGLFSYEIFKKKEQDASDNPVKIRIMKYSELAYGSLGIDEININGEGARVVALPEDNRPILEVIGDSITCGYGNEADVTEIFKTETENPWDAYSCKTARKLGFDFRLISWSGDGIISQYLGEYSETPRKDTFYLPELYPYANCEEERRLGIGTLDPATFSNYTRWNPERKPDYIIINLGTNDSSFTREIPERNELFVNEYYKFVKMVREMNPSAKILCILGIMIQCLDKEVERAVELVKADGDDKIFFLRAPLQKEEDGYGADGHPTLKTHEKMAVMLEEFIKKNMM